MSPQTHIRSTILEGAGVEMEYAGCVLTNGTYITNTNIHSKDCLLHDCTSRHLGYNNRSLYNSDGVYCTYYHGSPQYQTHLGKLTLNYTGTILPVQGNYNTGSEIHTTSRTLMLPNQTSVYNDNCGTCHDLIYDSGYDLHSRGTDCSACHYEDNIEYQGTVREKPIEHSENITRLSCTECHFNWTIMDDYLDKPVYYVNGTMFNDSVHSLQTGIQCRDPHFSPPAS